MLTLFARGTTAVWNEVTGETQWEDPGGENARCPFSMTCRICSCSNRLQVDDQITHV